MKANLVLIAHKFCSEHFSDLSIDQKTFLTKVDELVTIVEPMEDKLILLNEVIRIGKLYYCSANERGDSFDQMSILTAN